MLVSTCRIRETSTAQEHRSTLPNMQQAEAAGGEEVREAGGGGGSEGAVRLQKGQCGRDDQAPQAARKKVQPSVRVRRVLQSALTWLFCAQLPTLLGVVVLCSAPVAGGGHRLAANILRPRALQRLRGGAGSGCRAGRSQRRQWRPGAGQGRRSRCPLSWSSIRSVNLSTCPLVFWSSGARLMAFGEPVTCLPQLQTTASPETDD